MRGFGRTTMFMPAESALTYTNPVYGDYFADPFVFRHGGVYYAFGTGPRREGEAPGQFRTLRSRDLIRWTEIGFALVEPSEFQGGDFWAPEVTYANGRFFMVYSVGQGDAGHHLRLAVATRPEGPYEDAGRLSPESVPFAIDGHFYRHLDGDWFLFYAMDFLDGDRPGTSIVVDRLVTMDEPEGRPRVVARATADWQRYMADRPIYGGRYDWHTLEGPCVRRRDGRIYCFYSGGNWQSEGYGVDFVVAEHPLGPYLSETVDRPRTLRSRPGEVLGPGHNSLVLSPDGETEVMVYHGWDPALTARLMRIDPLRWTPEGPVVDGPSVATRELR